jgi:hypothetical protein
VDLCVGGVLQVLGGCARAHPPDVAPELVSESETLSRAFICICNCCSFGGFVGSSYSRSGDVGVVVGAGILADATDMTAPSKRRSVSASLHVVDVEASWLCVDVSPGRAHEWAKVLLTRRAWRRR